MKAYIIDIYGLAHRLFYSSNQARNSDGQEVGMLYAVAKTLLDLQERHSPEFIVAAFDSPGRTWRHNRYADYKANRQPKPDSLKEQLFALPELVSSLGVSVVASPGFEADDVIASLVDRFARPGLVLQIVSSDKDLMALVGNGVTQYDPLTNTHFDTNGVRAKLGVHPCQIHNWLALMGDASDNIPGVPKVGKKWAQRIVDVVPVDIDGKLHLDEVTLANAGLPEKITRSLLDSRDFYDLSWELAQLRRDVPLGFSLSQAAQGIDPERADSVLIHYGFKDLRSYVQAEAF
jgi:DNA polymerase-1